nr:hypothetical protein [Pantoea sp. 201603H]
MFVNNRLFGPLAALVTAKQANVKACTIAKSESKSAPAGFTALGGAQQSYPGKWRPEQRFTLSSDEDGIIFRGEKAAANVYKMPAANRFMLFPDPGAETVADKSVDVSAHAFGRITLADRLDIHGHGSTTHVGNLNAEQMATHLISHGLREVGILKLQACNSGKNGGEYLYGLREHLTRHGVKVGYITGYEDVLYDARSYVLDLKFAQVKWPNGLAEKVIQPTGLPFVKNVLVPAHMKQSIIKGNVDVNFTGSRYSLPPEPLDQMILKAQVCNQKDFAELFFAVKTLDKSGGESLSLALLGNAVKRQDRLSDESLQLVRYVLSDTLKTGSRSTKVAVCDLTKEILNTPLNLSRQDKLLLLNNLKNNLPLVQDPMALTQGLFLPLDEVYSRDSPEKKQYMAELQQQVNKCTQINASQKLAIKDVLTAMR